MLNFLNLEEVKSISVLKGLRARHDQVETKVKSLDNLGLQPNHYKPILITALMGVPKRSFVFSERNTKFYSCTQTAIRFLQRNMKFRIVPKWPFVFL